MLWDTGNWKVTGKHNADRIDFSLDGRKLKGAWTLVRTGASSGRPANNWLLIKRGTQDVSATEAHSRSIHSGRSMKEIASGAAFDKTTCDQTSCDLSAIATNDSASMVPGDIPGARRRTLPTSFAPQLATAISFAPDGDDWVGQVS